MFHQFVEYLGQHRTMYEFGGTKTLAVSRHWYSGKAINIAPAIGKNMLHIYPDDQFSYMHASIDIYTELPYTWSSLKKSIEQKITFRDNIDVHQWHRCIDNIIVNEKKGARVLGSIGKLHFRIKYRALKRSTVYFPHPFIVPYSLGLVQEFHSDTNRMLIFDIQDDRASYIKLDSYRISSLSSINYGVDQLLKTLFDAGITNLTDIGEQSGGNMVGDKLIYQAMSEYVEVFAHRLGKTGSYKIMLTGSLLRYPFLAEKFIDALSIVTGNFVGLYIGEGIIVGNRVRSTDELYIKHHIHQFSKKQVLFTSFSAPTI